MTCRHAKMIKAVPMELDETASGRNPWASNSIGNQAHVAFDALQVGLTVA